MKKTVIIEVIILVAALMVIFVMLNGAIEEVVVTNFEECIAAGNPAMESYPRQCIHGQDHFVEDIGNELDKQDMIRIDSPRPGAVITSPWDFTGQAIGPWYSEAVFPVELEDSNGNVIASSYGQAQGEWMTEEFVVFEGRIIFDIEGEQSATLVLKKQNASGLPENDDELRVPIRIK